MSALSRAPWICLPLATELGEFQAGYSDAGLAALHFPSDKTVSTLAEPASAPARIQQWHRVTTEAVTEILAGRKPKALPPFDLSRGTEFQQRVWRAMTRIPLGRTRTYGELASAIGKPKAVRAVGGACGANPIPVLVPCHRVLAAKHKIGGFSGGLERKFELLKREGVSLI
ncbi:MAG TPA: methylated-DNA--[protein]-cysteine S-methyltransferase [Verrucomicrobiae bacterium]|nr:methylated-DNA--[protein]-cysteine S-methyltransferase [Verrucomicrobiae bacterium]